MQPEQNLIKIIIAAAEPSSLFSLFLAVIPNLPHSFPQWHSSTVASPSSLRSPTPPFLLLSPSFPLPFPLFYLSSTFTALQISVSHLPLPNGASLP